MTRPTFTDQDRQDHENNKRTLGQFLESEAQRSQQIWDVGQCLGQERGHRLYLLDRPDFAGLSGDDGFYLWTRDAFGFGKQQADRYIRVHETFKERRQQLAGHGIGVAALHRITEVHPVVQEAILKAATLQHTDGRVIAACRAGQRAFRDNEKLVPRAVKLALAGESLPRPKDTPEQLAQRALRQLCRVRGTLDALEPLLPRLTPELRGRLEEGRALLAPATRVNFSAKPAESPTIVIQPEPAPAPAPEPEPLPAGGAAAPPACNPAAKGLDGVVYSVEPAPRAPVTLPADWDKRTYLYRPSAIACFQGNPAEPLPYKNTFLMGLRRKTGQPVALDVSGFPALAFYGTLKSGKTYAQGSFLESMVLRHRSISQIEMPFCGILFCFGSGRDNEYLCSVLANRRSPEVHRLMEDYHTLPMGFPDVLFLTLEGHVERMQLRNPHVPILGLKFPSHRLGKTGLHALFHLDGRERTQYGAEIDDLIDQLLHEERTVELRALEERVKGHRFTHSTARHIVQSKLRLAHKWIDDRRDWSGYEKDGRLIVVHIDPEWLPHNEAMMVFGLATQVLAIRPESERRCALALAWDEAYKFAKHPAARLQIEHIFRQRRHLGVVPMIASQDPLSVPDEIHALLDGVGFFRHSSGKWLKHVGRSLEVVKRMPVDMAAKLEDGEMWFHGPRAWWNLAEDADLSERMLIVQVRPRMSQHGGNSWTVAVGEEPKVVYT